MARKKRQLETMYSCILKRVSYLYLFLRGKKWLEANEDYYYIQYAPFWRQVRSSPHLASQLSPEAGDYQSGWLGAHRKMACKIWLDVALTLPRSLWTNSESSSYFLDHLLIIINVQYLPWLQTRGSPERLPDLWESKLINRYLSIKRKDSIRRLTDLTNLNAVIVMTGLSYP